MIKFYRLSKFNFALQNQRHRRTLVEMAAFGLISDKLKSYD